MYMFIQSDMIVCGIARHLPLQLKMNGFCKNFPNQTLIWPRNNTDFYSPMYLSFSNISLNHLSPKKLMSPNLISYGGDRPVGICSQPCRTSQMRFALRIQNSQLPVLSVSRIAILLLAAALSFSFVIIYQQQLRKYSGIGFRHWNRLAISVGQRIFIEFAAADNIRQLFKKRFTLPLFLLSLSKHSWTCELVNCWAKRMLLLLVRYVCATL